MRPLAESRTQARPQGHGRIAEPVAKPIGGGHGMCPLGMPLFAEQVHLFVAGRKSRSMHPEQADRRPGLPIAPEQLTHLLEDFGIEIGSSFGPLKGRISRIGTMGYVCRKENVLLCLGALEATLRQMGFRAPAGAAVDAALSVYRASEKEAKREE